MTKNLVIVESPAKARTINKYLGKDFVVKASMGHVRDLPKGKLGIDVDHDFATQYLVIKTRSDTVKELKKSAKSADTVYLAPDPDREGEAIAWHLVHALDLPEEKVYRITFNEITKKAVQAALKSPGKVNEHLVNAQQARRILDRLVGYKLSPLLWAKIARGLSAGRVQSVALRLIAEREKEIRAFKPEEYWKVVAHLKRGATGIEFAAELKKKDGKTLELTNQADTEAVLKDLEGAAFKVTSVETKEKSLKAPPPFSTSLLQQQASIQLRFAAKRTMRVAQQLYEGVDIGGDEGSVGLITYMRTDSYRLADEAIDSTRALIGSSFGAKYLPEKPNRYAARKGAQEAHEAVRPTDVQRTPDSVRDRLTAEQYRLYKLIWDRTVACQMANARFDQTSIAVDAGAYTFATRGRALLFDGFLKVAGIPKAEGEQDLPTLSVGDPLDTRKIEHSQHFTQPPARYSEATLVKALEKNGIGRPSTYATIISTIQDRGYVKLLERKFHATDLGEVVSDSLVANFPDIFDYEFTAGMESKLDLIEGQQADWLKVVRDFYEAFTHDLAKAESSMVSLKALPTELKCPECGKPMLSRMNRFGRFLGCSGYPECKYIQRINEKGEAEDKGPGPEVSDEKCEACGKPMLIRTGRRGRFMSCSDWPKCKKGKSYSVDADNKPIKPIVTDIACQKCEEGKMVVRFSKRGPFLGCSRYPKCRGTQQLPEDMKGKYKRPKAATGDEPVEDAPEGAEVETSGVGEDD